MIGYVLGLGDRHMQNILIDKSTAELIHIDLGIAFEQVRIQGLLLYLLQTHTKPCLNLAGCDLNAILAGTGLHNMGPS